MIQRFVAHPHAVGETYGEHAAAAAGFGGLLIAAGLACLVHAILPWMFETTASGLVVRLHNRMAARRAMLAA
ncbi:DUF6356 family protein [Phenylobacterium sp.]|uniref:DUF6356 family protein n=1 Tax=Phenylobacterium sp. TaxID=1871053 RepID=UPI002DEF1CEA|nr:DUF6356 family protein [Phenylobacterium sp.]